MNKDILKTLIEALTGGEAHVEVINADDRSSGNKLRELMQRLGGPKGADDIAANLASYNAKIDEALAKGDMDAPTADWYRGMQAWMDNEATDEQKFTLVQLKEQGFGAFAGLWLVRERGFNADKACLMRYSMKLALEPLLRHLATDMMHAAEGHGLGLVTAQLALDYDAHQAKAEAWIVELSSACVARIGEHLGTFPSAAQLDLEDSRIASERLIETFNTIKAKESGQIQEG